MNYNVCVRVLLIRCVAIHIFNYYLFTLFFNEKYLKR